MGIKQLFQIIKDEAPDAIKEGEIKNHFGRKVAIVCLTCTSHFPCSGFYYALTVIPCHRMLP